MKGGRRAAVAAGLGAAALWGVLAVLEGDEARTDVAPAPSRSGPAPTSMSFPETPSGSIPTSRDRPTPRPPGRAQAPPQEAEPQDGTKPVSEDAGRSAVSVVGQVVDPDGQGVAEATVVCDRVEDGGQGLGAFQPVVTGPAGHFEAIFSAELGAVPCRARRRGFGPSEPVWATLPPLEELHLVLSAGGTIRGEVQGPADLSQALVTVEGGTTQLGEPVPPRGVRALPVTLQGGRGPFELGPLEPGLYDLFADADGYGNGRLAGVRVKANAETEDVILRLRRGLELSGRVTDVDTGLPVVGAKVVLGDAFRLDRALRARGDVTAPDGTFRLGGIEPGPRSLYVKHREYVKRILAGVNPARQGWLEVKLRRRADAEGPRAEYFGIGASISEEEGRITFESLSDGSPAAEAGVQPGDELLSIDGRPVSELSLREVVDRLRGMPDSQVSLQVQGPASAPPRDVTIRRERVPLGGSG